MHAFISCRWNYHTLDTYALWSVQIAQEYHIYETIFRYLSHKCSYYTWGCWGNLFDKRKIKEYQQGKREKKMSHLLQFLGPNVTSLLLLPFVWSILAFILILLFKWSSTLQDDDDDDDGNNKNKKDTTFTNKAPNHRNFKKFGISLYASKVCVDGNAPLN